MCFKKIKALFGHKETKAKLEEPPEQRPKKEVKLERRILTGHGGPNMPKSQPCPECRGRAKRESKTMGGANYHCNKHGSFFVGAR